MVLLRCVSKKISICFAWVEFKPVPTDLAETLHPPGRSANSSLGAVIELPLQHCYALGGQHEEKRLRYNRVYDAAIREVDRSVDSTISSKRCWLDL